MLALSLCITLPWSCTHCMNTTRMTWATPHCTLRRLGWKRTTAATPLPSSTSYFVVPEGGQRAKPAWRTLTARPLLALWCTSGGSGGGGDGFSGDAAATHIISEPCRRLRRRWLAWRAYSSHRGKRWGCPWRVRGGALRDVCLAATAGVKGSIRSTSWVNMRLQISSLITNFSELRIK